MSDLTGKTAVIMGASGEANFGSASARRFAEAGANVVVAARRLDALESLAEEIGGLAVACDITDEAQIENLFSQATAKYGNVDIALNSSGIHAHMNIAELTRDEILPTLEVSFIGALLFFKHAAAAMQNGGSVITVSSLTSRLPGQGYSVYSGTRAGIDYAIKNAALEYADQGIRFNSIAAGLIETDMTAGLFAMPGVVDTFTAMNPCRRMGTIQDFAETALWLADGKASGFINGHVIDLAGGQQMGQLPG